MYRPDETFLIAPSTATPLSFNPILEMAALSQRGARNVQTYVGHLPISLTEVIDDNDWIDLSFAENYTIRSEVLEIFREAAASDLTEKVRFPALTSTRVLTNTTIHRIQELNWPHGFWGEAKLFTALSSLFNSYFSPFKAIENKNIVLTTGAAGSLDGVAWGICDPGEGVLVPCPYHTGTSNLYDQGYRFRSLYYNRASLTVV